MNSSTFWNTALRLIYRPHSRKGGNSQYVSRLHTKNWYECIHAIFGNWHNFMLNHIGVSLMLSYILIFPLKRRHTAPATISIIKLLKIEVVYFVRRTLAGATFGFPESMCVRSRTTRKIIMKRYQRIQSQMDSVPFGRMPYLDQTILLHSTIYHFIRR